MKPIEFPEMTGVAAETQPEFENMPMYRDADEVISCWELTPEEIKEIIETGHIWVRLYAGSGFIQPIIIQTERPWDPPETDQSYE